MNSYPEVNLEAPCFRIDGSVPKDERVRQIEGFKKIATGGGLHHSDQKWWSRSQPPRGDSCLYYSTIMESCDRTPSYRYEVIERVRRNQSM